MTVNVRPRVGFGRSGRLYVAKVTSDLTYAGRYVWVQRKAPFGSFRNVKRIFLGANSRAVFSAKLPKGRSVLRLVLPDSQAGVGYVAEHEPPDPAQALTPRRTRLREARGSYPRASA